MPRAEQQPLACRLRWTPQGGQAALRMHAWCELWVERWLLHRTLPLQAPLRPSPPLSSTSLPGRPGGAAPLLHPAVWPCGFSPDRPVRRPPPAGSSSRRRWAPGSWPPCTCWCGWARGWACTWAAPTARRSTLTWPRPACPPAPTGCTGRRGGAAAGSRGSRGRGAWLGSAAGRPAPAPAREPAHLHLRNGAALPSVRRPAPVPFRRCPALPRLSLLPLLQVGTVWFFTISVMAVGLPYLLAVLPVNMWRWVGGWWAVARRHRHHNPQVRALAAEIRGRPASCAVPLSVLAPPGCKLRELSAGFAIGNAMHCLQQVLARHPGPRGCRGGATPGAGRGHQRPRSRVLAGGCSMGRAPALAPWPPATQDCHAESAFLAVRMLTRCPHAPNLHSACPGGQPHHPRRRGRPGDQQWAALAARRNSGRRQGRCRHRRRVCGR